ncbi:hypothetical protein LTR94_025851, partial [Friedmanniomyces endolithicus]
MELVDRYLKAVAAQLPKEGRDDIVEELREDILARIEAAQDTAGRPLNEDEVEALLREVGHPLTVAARYTAGPQALIGPELYPWWMFAVKVALTVLACVTLIGLAVKVLAGEVYLAQAISQGFASLFGGAISVIGLVTLAGFILERQERKPDFIMRWRVKDLAVFEWGGELDAEAFGRGLARGDWSGARSKSGQEVKKSAQMSPAAKAVAGAIGWSVLLLWWMGLLPVAQIRPDLWAGVVDGVDYGRILGEVVDAAYWPVALFAACRAGFDLVRAALGGERRLAGIGDLVFGLVAAWGLIWLWFWSALSPVIFVSGVNDFVLRIQNLFDDRAEDVG